MKNFSPSWEVFEFPINHVGMCLASRVSTLNEALLFYRGKFMPEPVCGVLDTWAIHLSHVLSSRLLGSEGAGRECFVGWMDDCSSAVFFVPGKTHQDKAVVVVVPGELVPPVCFDCDPGEFDDDGEDSDDEFVVIGLPALPPPTPMDLKEFQRARLDPTPFPKINSRPSKGLN